MERNEISIHEVKVYVALESGGWMTNQAIAAAAGVAPRTARCHTLRLVKLGILDQAELFPAHQYRVSSMAGKRNATYLQRLTNAREIFRL